MKKTDRNSLIAFPLLVIVGALVAYAGSQGGSTFNGIPVFALCIGLTFVIQWIVFIPSYLRQTEKFFDLTGSLTYIAVITIGLLLSGNYDARVILLWALVVIWAVRLGTFLFRRIKKAGKDDRFDELKPSFIRFLNVWTIQALWVTFTFAAALVAITTIVRKGLDAFAVVGFLIWIFGRWFF
jgi:steroid 5-alpha reductase family enzyme